MIFHDPEYSVWALSFILAPGAVTIAQPCTFKKKKKTTFRSYHNLFTYLLGQRHAQHRACVQAGGQLGRVCSLLHHVSSRQHIQVVGRVSIIPGHWQAGSLPTNHFFPHFQSLSTTTHNTWIYCSTFIYPSFLMLLPFPFLFSIHCSFNIEYSEGSLGLLRKSA